MRHQNKKNKKYKYQNKKINLATKIKKYKSWNTNVIYLHINWYGNIKDQLYISQILNIMKDITFIFFIKCCYLSYINKNEII